jgi:hypothetical protein
MQSACILLSYFSTLCYEQYDFSDETLLNTKFVFWSSLQLPSQTFFTLRRIQRDIIINVHKSSFKVPVMLVIFKWKLNFLERFSKNSSNIKFNQNPSIGSRVDPYGRTDKGTKMTKLIVTFRNFANTPKKRIFKFMVWIFFDFYLFGVAVGLNSLAARLLVDIKARNGNCQSLKV